MKSTLKLVVFISFSLINQWSVAQVSIKQIRIQPEKKYYNTPDTTITYPIISIGDNKVDGYINQLIAERIIGDDFQTDSTGRNLSLKEQLIACSREGLDYMDYSVTLNRNNLLSIEFTMEWTAAYSTSWTQQINIDLLARKLLTFEDIIDQNKIRELKKNLYQQKLKQIADNISEKNEGFSSLEIQETIELSQECIEDDSIENFLFREKDIQFIDECYFPHVIQNMRPLIELNYSYPEMKNYLKPEFLKRTGE